MKLRLVTVTKPFSVRNIIYADVVRSQSEIVHACVLYNLVHCMPICNHYDLQLKYARFRYLHVYICKINGQFTWPACCKITLEVYKTHSGRFEVKVTLLYIILRCL